MGYYEHNLEVIKKHRIYLYEQLGKETALLVDDNIEVTTVSTRTEANALQVMKGGSLTRLNSKYDPEQEALKWAEQYQFKNLDTVIAMFGLGNGVFVRELMKKMDKDNKLLILEPSTHIFEHVLEHYPMEDILSDKRVLVVVQGKNDFEFPYYLSKTLTWMNLYSQVECFHPGYERLFTEAYQAFKRMLEDNTFNNLVAKNTHGLMGKGLVDNAIRNLLRLENSISFWDLCDRLPKDVPVIIVSAGPSLKKNVELLKDAKGKSIIFAVDRAYATLLEHNIEPDFVVLLDAMKPLIHCGNKPGFQTPLLCKLEGSQQIMNNHSGKKIIYDCVEFTKNIYKQFGKKFYTVSTGGSVTTAAFALSAKAGFKRIILIGSDLAYAGEVTHVDKEQLPVDEKEGLIELYVEDIYGNKVKTRHDWYTFIRWFEIVILQMANYDVIDATEGGARIKGTRIMTLREVVSQYCNIEIDCESIINEIEPTFTHQELVEINKYFKKAKQELVEMKDIARKTVVFCQKLKQNVMLNKSNSSESRRLVRSISETNKSIESMSIFSLVNQYVISVGTDNIEGLYFMTNDKKQDEILAYENSEKVYKSIIESCDFMIPTMNNVLGFYKRFQ